MNTSIKLLKALNDIDENLLMDETYDDIDKKVNKYDKILKYIVGLSTVMAIFIGIIVVANPKKYKENKPGYEFPKESFEMKDNVVINEYFVSSSNEEDEDMLSQSDKNIILDVTMNLEYITGDIEELYKDSSVVLIADYIGDEKTEIQQNGTPFTFSQFKIKKVIKNESGKDLAGSVVAQRMGGVITLQQLLDARGEAFAQKLGAEKISKSEAEKSFVKFSCADGIEDESLEEHKTRLLMLNYDENSDCFVVVQNSYGMLSYKEQDNTAFDIHSKKYTNYTFLK